MSPGTQRRPKIASHEQYFAAAPPEVQEILRKVQEVVEAALPMAERCISYNIPAYRSGKVCFYFAAFKTHLGVYPPLRSDPVLVRELSDYRNEKGNLRFKYSDGIPFDLIRRVALALAKEYAGR